MNMRLSIIVSALLVLPAVAPALPAAEAAAPSTTLVIPLSASATPLPHFWEQMFGSGRAVLSLRDSYRQDLRAVRQVTDFQYVRFHNILHDELGLYSVDAQGQPVYNFSYVDQIYDGLLENGIRPFVEISFMPQALAADKKDIFVFWYHPNVDPPGSYERWDELMRRFATHLVDRYGIDEVAQWYFEVWNEPNIGFWGGKPEKPTYYELYEHTARALKAVNARLRVGGPSTAQAAWVGDFIATMQKAQVPVDFVSSHVYANDTADNVFGTKEVIPRDRMVCRAVRKVHEEILKSPQPGMPFFLSEFNASYANEPDVTDSVYMGPWLADTIRQCAGMVDQMSYWSFSDVFEEQGVVRTPFYGGFGLVAERGIRKPAYNAFALLHRLGDSRLAVDSDSALVTKRGDGTLVVALWNYAEPDGTGEKYTGPPATVRPPRHFSLRFDGAAATAPVTLWRLDGEHGNVVKLYDSMGRPAFPSREQIEQLKAASHLPAPEAMALQGGVLELDIPRHGLVVLEVTP